MMERGRHDSGTLLSPCGTFHRTIACSFVTSTFPSMPSLRPFTFAVGTLLLASCRDPRAEANIAEAMIQVGTEISAMRQDFAVLQGQVDSLRGVVARQDTLITRLAALANMPVPAR
jgi:hypothetical protein